MHHEQPITAALTTWASAFRSRVEGVPLVDLALEAEHRLEDRRVVQHREAVVDDLAELAARVPRHRLAEEVVGTSSGTRAFARRAAARSSRVAVRDRGWWSSVPPGRWAVPSPFRHRPSRLV